MCLIPMPMLSRPPSSACTKHGHYGLAWAETMTDAARLPYAENVVNLIVIGEHTVPLEELVRVLTPGGSIVVLDTDLLPAAAVDRKELAIIEESDAYLVMRKRWPDAMDSWSHPRHAADGNAVSLDTLVGPPERVRWIAAATSEVEGMVTAGGRNFYGGVLARDSFNGLRLWHRNLNKKGENNPEDFNLPRLPREGSRPIASEQYLFSVLQGRPVALQAATGEVVCEFGDLVNPTALLFDGSSNHCS